MFRCVENHRLRTSAIRKSERKSEREKDGLGIDRIDVCCIPFERFCRSAVRLAGGVPNVFAPAIYSSNVQ